MEEEDEGPLEPPPRPIISPGFGYYYPAKIYELPARTPAYAAQIMAPM